MPRTDRPYAGDLRLHYWARGGGRQIVIARLLDINSKGAGVETLVPLDAGASVAAAGKVIADGVGMPIDAAARVAYCRRSPAGIYRVGLAFEDLANQESRYKGETESPPAPDPPFMDYYEVMQLSSNSDIETVHQVYRMLAKRYHPDNRETGNEELFKQLVRAYSVLSDTEQRSAHDEQRATRRPAAKSFALPKSPTSIAVEKAKRHKVLSLLYTKRLQQAAEPHLTLIEIEALTGVPRESLEFTLWYLKEAGWVVRSDGGRHVITIKGVDQAETEGLLQPLLLETLGAELDGGNAAESRRVI